MNILEVKPGIFFCDAPDAASNVTYFKTSEGIVLIDTTTTVENMQAVLDLAEITPDDVKLVIITHADGDHIGGNSLFNCPILAHEKTLNRMQQADRPENELPTEAFNQAQKTLHFGELEIELIYKGGHKEDLVMLWLPQEKVLLPSDLVFEGRYPFMMSSDVAVWIAALKSLRDYGATVILPGHGTVCSLEEVNVLIHYMETTWKIVSDHAAHRDSLEKTVADPILPRPAGWIREQLFAPNIEAMYKHAIENQ
ncbi:MAG: MBL fold metallo-hydrolase [Anaerolineales bacterium]|jgi:cyclase